MRGLALYKSGVDDIVGVHVTVSLVFHLNRRCLKLLANSFHRSARTSGRKPDVVHIHERGAPIQALIARVTHKAQACIGFAGDVRQGTEQVSAITRRQHRLSPAELQRFDSAPRRLIYLRHHFGPGRAGAELRLIRKFLQRVVVPELHFDATIARPSPGRIVGSERSRRTEAIAVHGRGGQAQAILHSQCNPSRPGLGQADVGSVDTLHPSGQW